MRRTLEEWRSLALPQGISEEEANDFQAQIIIEAVHDIDSLYAAIEKKQKCEHTGSKFTELYTTGKMFDVNVNQCCVCNKTLGVSLVTNEEIMQKVSVSMVEDVKKILFKELLERGSLFKRHKRRRRKR